MSSLKDALKQAGFNSSRTQNERPKMRKKDKKQAQIHQEERNFCEVCELVQPDVERYKHRNPTIDVEWICGRCADTHQIHDKFRVTEQSSFSKKNMFLRGFGPTLKPEKK